MHRLFVAIRPPEAIRDLLIDAMDEGADFHWQDEDQLHLTLRFIGDIERALAEDLAAALGQIRANRFSIRLNGVGRFARRNSGALWAGVEPRPPLVALAAKIERCCHDVGLEPERRAYLPHITLARWKGRRTRDVAAFVQRVSALTSAPFEVTEFTLFESHLSRHGALYQAVAPFPLA